MRLIRGLISLAILGLFIYLGATINLGRRTLFGHIANVWRSEEAAELREDVGDTAGPVIDRARRGARAGWEAATQAQEPSDTESGGVLPDAGPDARDG